MRFRFRLAQVLTVRRIWEDRAKQTLAERTLERWRDESELLRRGEALAAAWDELTAPGPRAGAALGAGCARLATVRRLYADQEERTVRSREAWAAAREEYLARRADREVLSRLEQRKKDEYLIAVRQSETKEIDQVAGLAYIRRRRKG